MTNSIDIRTHRASFLDDETLRAFGGLTATDNDGILPIVGVGVAFEGKAKGNITALADHGYYAWAPGEDPRRHALRHLPDAQRRAAAIAGAELLNDKNLKPQAVLMRCHVRKSYLTDLVDSTFEYVQTPYCSVMMRTDADLIGEVAEAEAAGGDFGDFIRGFASVGVPEEPLSGHQILRQSQLIYSLMFGVLWDLANKQDTNLNERLRGVKINLLPPKVA